MKIAVQIDLIRANSTRDKVKWAKDHGVEGIELTPMPHDQLRAVADDVLKELPVTSLCGTFTSDGKRNFDLLDPDVVKRRLAVEVVKKCLDLCGQMKAVGLIVVPIFGPPRVPDLSPFADPRAIEERLMVAHCKDLGPFAAAHKTRLMLEPLNRYEQHYLRRQSDAVRVIKKAKVKGVGLLSDFFHMHIEETNTPKTFERVGKYISHIHLADNTRLEPGTGDIDFVSAFRALRKVAFRGYMAYECGISGSDEKQQRTNLAKSIEYLRDCWKA